MNEEQQRGPREADLAFFGWIGADVSHDMRNILAVIGQYAGLMEDTLALARRFRSSDRRKLEQLCAKIDLKVQDGTDTMDRFSRFAHAADAPSVAFDPGAVIENLVALLQRHARQASYRLEADLPAEAVSLTSDPFALQYAVFSAVELVGQVAAEGELVQVILARRGNEAVIRVAGRAGDDEPAELSAGVARLTAAMHALNGSVESSRVEGMLAVALTVPIEP